MIKKDELPPNCPMVKADYEHYCPSPGTGPETYKRTGKCHKHDECGKIVSDFKKMGVKKSSVVFKVITS